MTLYPAELLAADNMLDIDRPQKALDILGELGNKYFDHSFYWLLTGHSNFLLRNYEQAERAAKEGLALDANNHQLLFLMSKLENEKGDGVSAEKYILEALKIFPERVIYLVYYAMLLTRVGQVDKAKKVIARARQYEPDHEGIPYVEGLIAYLEGDDKGATAYIDQAIQDNPEDEAAYSVKGSLLLRQGKTGEGIANLRRAASMNPSDDDLVNSARSVDPMRHWSMLPMRPVYRWGPGRIWLAAIAIIFGLRALGFEQIVFPVAMVYLVWVVYTWIAPRLFVWWHNRQLS